jgi:hypothetical protein
MIKRKRKLGGGGTEKKSGNDKKMSSLYNSESKIFVTVD